MTEEPIPCPVKPAASHVAKGGGPSLSPGPLAATRRVYIVDQQPRIPNTYPSLVDLASAIQQEFPDDADDAPGPCPATFQIVLGRMSGAPLSKRPLRRFYYHVPPFGAPGDGSERDPWPSLSSAILGIDQQIQSHSLIPKPGDWLELRRHLVFAATSVENHRRRIETVAKYMSMAMAYVLVIPLVAILSFLLVKAWPALSWNFLVQNPQERMTAGGIWAPLVGTFFLVLLSLLLAAPIGILAGVYLNEYAKDNWFNRLINLAVVNLAGVPSIVHALFGVGAFVLAAGFGESLLAASCTLAVMTLPVIIASTREAVAAVPMSFREACWNLGATRWQTIRTIVLPNSISGILTGVILQVARTAGETAPILFTGAAFFLPVAENGWGYFFPYRLGDKVMALSMHLFTLRTQVNLPREKQYIEFGTAVVLIGLVLAVNSTSIAYRVYLRTRKKW